MNFLFVTVSSFLFYLLLTAGSGDAFLIWPVEELILGAFLSIILGIFIARIIPKKIPARVFNPLNWLLFILYLIVPFLFSLAMANFEVVYRVITGKFHPAIVKVDTGLKSETGTVVLANSITLTPGTLTVKMRNDSNQLYIHCLEWKKPVDEKATPKDVSGPLYWWIKKIFG